MCNICQLMRLALAAASVCACATAAVPADAPVEIRLLRAGQIEVRRDAHICVELSPDGTGGRGPNDYEVARAMSASVQGVEQVMTEARADPYADRHYFRIRTINGNYDVDTECPDAARDLRILLRLSQDLPETPYRLIVEFRQGDALYRKGIDRRGQPMPRIPPITYGCGYIGDPFDTRTWTLESDARRLTAELAALVHWSSER
jgi:hypothetical protein